MAARARDRTQSGSFKSPVSGSWTSPISGARPSRYVLVRECMARYISPILVDSVLRRAMETAGVTSMFVAPETVETVVEQSMVGLRLFVDPAKLPDLMVELADILARGDA